MYDWFKLFSLVEFLDTGLVSRTIKVDLEGLGQKDILITQGNTTGVLYEDTFLTISGVNPHKKGIYSLYLDPDQNVWLGVTAS